MKPSRASGVAAPGAMFSLRLAGELARRLGDAGIGLLILAALVVAWRRLVGALDHPAAPAILLAAGLLAATLAATFRVERGSSRFLTWIGPALVLAVFAAALSVRGTGVLGLTALWAPILAEEAWSTRRRFGPPRSRPARRTAELLDLALGMVRTASLAEPQTDGEVTQQLVRSRSADGTETLSGWLRLAFAPGQRQATAHLSFCPPFAQTPLLEVHQSEGPPARVKTGQVLAYGARLEVKLAAPADAALVVRLTFSARCGEPSAR